MKGTEEQFYAMGEKVSAIEYHIAISKCASCASSLAEALADVCVDLIEALEERDFKRNPEVSKLSFDLSVGHLDHLRSTLLNIFATTDPMVSITNTVAYINNLLDMLSDLAADHR